MKLDFKLKAGALQLVLMISSLILLLLLSFSLLHQYHRLYNTKTSYQVLLQKGSIQGINRLISEEQSSSSYDVNGVFVEVHRSPWGIFELLHATSKKGKLENKRTALVGSSAHDSTALYLADKGLPVYFAGSSSLAGEVYLPQRQWNFATIEGQSTNRENPIQGRIKASSQVLPDLGLPEAKFAKPYKRVSVSSLAVGYDSLTYIIKGDVIDLKNKNLKGQIVIQATERILIDSTSQLQGVLLEAPEILIGNNVSGNFQAFANRKIEVGDNCVLNYPTVLSIESEAPGSIHLGRNTRLEGILLNLSSPENFQLPGIVVKKGAQLIGQVYTKGGLSLRGEVKGQVFADYIMAQVDGVTYVNNLYNTQIYSFNNLAPFAGLTWKENSKSTLAQWLR